MNADDSFRQYLGEWSERIERELLRQFPGTMDIPSSLKKSMIYSLTAGGKRIRPILMLSAVEALEGPVDECLPAACAVEMIHTYSLIHDDLPAMDNDDFRRGKPTNHKVFGEATAILAGDGLLTHAFYCVSRLRTCSALPAERILNIVEEMAWFAGPRGMVGGQAADMEGEQGITDLSQLEYIHRRKTGDLIIFSLRAGGHLAGANERQMDALEQFGASIGMAFQIQDDVLDLVGDEKKMGKSKSDEKSSKVTFPYFLGLDACRKLVRQHTEAGKKAILEAGIPRPERLLQLADYLMNRDR